MRAATLVPLSPLLLLACRSTSPSVEIAGAPTVVVPETSGTDAPMDVAQSDSAWLYLRDKYDLDGDGIVTAAEYDRDSGEIARLDRNGDGVVTADDYAAGESMQRVSDVMDAKQMIAEYLQDDENPTEIAVWEMFAAAEAYDANRDELIEEKEFRALAAERRQTPPDQGMRNYTAAVDPWKGLATVLDTDGDGGLSYPELEAFFVAEDDGDDVWRLDQEQQRMPASARTGAPASGAKKGELAPDFTLTPPEGGAAVTLSSFRGEKPVALIFGSYT